MTDTWHWARGTRHVALGTAAPVLPQEWMCCDRHVAIGTADPRLYCSIGAVGDLGTP